MRQDGRAGVIALLFAYAGFSWLLNFAWEVLQAPLYEGMRSALHPQAVWLCTSATAGDVGIALLGYGAAAAIQRDAQWILTAQPRAWVINIAIGLAMTVVLELISTGHLHRWAYADSMPLLPGTRLGLVPLLQWLTIPPLAIWLTRRHFLGGL